MKSSYNAVVVGAGPAGCSAAIHLHRRGVDVLLVDKAQFPRDKVCGDGIPRKCFPLLEELGVPAALLRDTGCAVDRLQIHGPGGECVAYGSAADPIASKGICCSRKEFDALLLQQAQRCLEQVQTGCRVVSLAPAAGGGHILELKDVVTGRQHTVTARLVIGADGAHSVVARCMPASGTRAPLRLFGLRMYCEAQGLEPDMHILYDRDTLPGYIWLFPVSCRRANIGMLVTRELLGRHGSRLVDFFKETVRRQVVFSSLQIMPEFDGEVMGCPLPVAPPRLTRVSAGVLLAGDAGALVNPLTGGGIYNALASGRLAAEVAATAVQNNDCSAVALQQYDVRWRRLLGSSFFYSGMLMRLLARPRVASGIIGCCARHRMCARLFMAFYGNPLPRLGPGNPLFWMHVARG